MANIGMQELVIVFLMIGMLTLMFVLPFWFICRKAGLSPWLSLLALVPLGAVVLPIILAVIEWPALKRVPPSLPPSA